MDTKILFFCTLFILLMISVGVEAQPPGLPKTPDQAPIDGGLIWLAAGGGAYAIKKLHDKRKE